MQKQTPKVVERKLVLARETLLALENRRLGKVVGGFSQPPLCRTGHTCPECAPP